MSEQRGASGHYATGVEDGAPARVLDVHRGLGLATCRVAGRATIVETDLVGMVVEGDVLLVHAGVALLRLTGMQAMNQPGVGTADSKAQLVRQIHALMEAGRSYRIVEVCGRHSHTLPAYGVDELLPPRLELVHAPGCPVCILPAARVDDAIALAEHSSSIVTCAADLLRIPGSHGSLAEARDAGADVRVVYSPLEALRMARENPRKHVVFCAVGFESQAAATALALRRARAELITNFLCLCNHVTSVAPVHALLDGAAGPFHALIAPGHVTSVIGTVQFEALPPRYGKPLILAGSGPLDQLQAIYLALAQLSDGRRKLELQHQRPAPPLGNLRALSVINEVFDLRPQYAWRGLGNLAHSAFQLARAYAHYDAELRWDLPSAHQPVKARPYRYSPYGDGTWEGGAKSESIGQADQHDRAIAERLRRRELA